MCTAAGHQTLGSMALPGYTQHMMITVMSVNCAETATSLAQCQVDVGVKLSTCNYGVSCVKNTGKCFLYNKCNFLLERGTPQKQVSMV